MGGGRDNSGARLYKYANGKYIRVGAYKDDVREASRMIDDFIKKPADEKAVLQYLQAIENRDRNAVISLDKQLKSGAFGTGENQQKLSAIRKTLLGIAGNNPEAIAKIHNTAKQKAQNRPKTISERVQALQTKYVGKKFRLTRNVQAGSATMPINLVYPKGTEGVVKKVKAWTYGGDGTLLPKTVAFDFLLDFGTHAKWFSSLDIAPVKG